MEPRTSDVAFFPGAAVLRRGRLSFRARRARLRAKGWQVGQAAVAAGVAWLVAHDLLGHDAPLFAPIAAVLGLGTTYGQRLKRIAEVTAGVAIGVLMADLLVAWIGAGWWQIVVVVGLAVSVAVMGGGGALLVNQAAVQSIFVLALLPTTGASFTRWIDAVIGGAVALVAATVVPSAPLRRPREQAARVLRKVAVLLGHAAQALREEDAERARALLVEARSTDVLVRELRAAADEGMAVVSSSPFRVRHKHDIRRMADLVDPMDRALRSTRVLVRQVSVATYRARVVPDEYVALVDELALAVDVVVAELAADRMAVAARPALLAVAQASGSVPRSDEMTAEVVLALLRSVVVDLLMVTGLDQLEATESLPPTPR
ncbi:FUSC family protein [Nocardioides bruguierae]|uniref:FUSC family protein n=1 Tax=Nocardioides bruguierae TaxID=2945102 RepID=UPI0020211BB5|nr:FUSC family protein [Nocardioides bruguierae]MCL8025082.1 FUSC family protein [Nocardioides bruguierae]